MTNHHELEQRLTALEATVRALQDSVAVLQNAAKAAQPSAEPELRSRGMLDRPRPRK
jgi:cell division septum initiation protein DivIVA